MTETGIAAREPAFETNATDASKLLIGQSPVFCRLREDLGRVASKVTPALISGEPGTGKSVLARTLHDASGRASEPFVVVPCGGFPETLLETELFGCVKGSVVGASRDRTGLLDTAHGGTVLLEDVEEMSLRTQGLLLKFMESGEVERVGILAGGTPADVRILASTRAPLQSLVGKGAFRDELWSRLTVSQLSVPSLRARRDDIPELVDYFARACVTGADRVGVVFTPEALRALAEYSWPGNVRELRSVVERLVAGARTPTIGAKELPVGIRPHPRAGRGRQRRSSVGEELFAKVQATGESFWSGVYPLFMRREITRRDLRDLIGRALDAARGNVHDLVRVLNMPGSDQQKFERFLRKYGCEPMP